MAHTSLTAPKLSLIVPAYRQGPTIVKNIKHLQKVLEQVRYEHELIVVIDGHTDDTLERLQKAKLPRLTCLAYDQNQGKSFAIRLGMSRAQGEYIMFIDSGMEIDPNGISMLLEHMEWYNADIIVGSKRHPASQVEYTWQRKLLSYGYYYFVKLLFGIQITDTQAGIKVFKRELLMKILPRVVEKRFAGDLEMLVIAYQLGYTRIFEAPIKLNYGLSSLTSAATLKEIRGIFVDTLAIFYRAKIINYYQHPHQNFQEPADLQVVNT
ncbi:MAG TPA: glycosyltransferase [Vitreimonas sp.]|nr:glycosyltransferase [Vitreimonas sp.]